MASCPRCGVAVPDAPGHCPRCGSRIDGRATRELELSPDETGPVPVSVTRAEPRLYGVAPSGLVIALAGLASALAIVLFASGHWPLGLILLGFAMLMLLVFAEGVRRRPPGRVVRSTAEAFDGFRARASVAADSLATRGRATRSLFLLRRELAQMVSVRGRLLFELGEAVYRGDEQATDGARAQVEELDRLIAQREAEMQAVVARAHERIERRRLEVQPTEIAVPPQEPARPPGEGDPPEPARIPEPYPPPDEGSPPQPAIIPEPGPAVIPEPGPQGPGQETD